MSPSSTRFACRCGKVTGTLTGIDPGEGTHVVCHCNSCRRAMEKVGLGAEAAGGVDIFQTTPDRIIFDTGIEHLKPLQLSQKGLWRWHALCCGTPIANTLKGPGVPFTGVMVRNLADPGTVGPVIAEGFIAGKDGKQRHKNGNAVIWRFIKRAALARLSGRGKRNPFFKADGSPIAAPGPFGEA